MSEFGLRLKKYNSNSPQLCCGSRQSKQNLITKKVQVPLSRKAAEESTFQWRKQTQLPFPELSQWHVSQKGVNDSQGDEDSGLFVVFEVTFQEQNLTLKTLAHRLPFFKIAYLLKQALVGLERLHAKFGPFLFNDEMVFINSEGKCQVWLNKNLYCNSFLAKSESENQFLYHIFVVFEEKTIETKLTKEFFAVSKRSKNFSEALKYLNFFVTKEKIIVPNRLKEAGAGDGSSTARGKRTFDPNLTTSRKPDFLSSGYRASEESDFVPSEGLKNRVGSQSPAKRNLKISEDTFAQTRKTTGKEELFNHSTASNSPRKVFHHSHHKKLLWTSDRQRIIPKKKPRKFSNKAEEDYQKIIDCYNPALIQHKEQCSFGEVTSTSILFMNPIEQSQRSEKSNSSSSNSASRDFHRQEFKSKGWSIRLNSLFAEGQGEYKKSHIEKDDQIIQKKKSHVKLQLLDKCPANVCESFMNQTVSSTSSEGDAKNPLICSEPYDL